jgi:hypothetical protein
VDEVTKWRLHMVYIPFNRQLFFSSYDGGDLYTNGVPLDNGRFFDNVAALIKSADAEIFGQSQGAATFLRKAEEKLKVIDDTA